LAVPGRLELPTFGLGNRCSILLSYGTELMPQAFPNRFEKLLGFCSPFGCINGEFSQSMSRREPGHAFWSKRDAYEQLSRGTFATFPMSACER
jgi:hypothetical protein